MIQDWYELWDVNENGLPIHRTKCMRGKDTNDRAHSIRQLSLMRNCPEFNSRWLSMIGFAGNLNYSLSFFMSKWRFTQQNFLAFRFWTEDNISTHEICGSIICRMKYCVLVGCIKENYMTVTTYGHTMFNSSATKCTNNW